jgi:hypothetical protein
MQAWYIQIILVEKKINRSTERNVLIEVFGNLSSGQT